MDPKSLFRKSALKHISSPDQLDQLIQVVSVKAWMLVIGIYVLLFSFIIWLLVGSVPTHAEGSGILLAGGGSIYSADIPDGPSRVDKILINLGGPVSKGQQIAVLSRPDLKDQITVSEKFIDDLSNKYAQLAALSNQEIISHNQILEQQRQVLESDLINDQAKLKNSEDLLATKQNAFKQGLQTRQSVDETLQEYYSIKSQVDDYQNKMAQLAIDTANFSDQWNERLRQLALKIADEEDKLNDLKGRQVLSMTVLSPVDGTVISVEATVGSVLNVGAPLATVASQGKGLDAIIFLPPQVGKRVKPGMEALVSPTTVEKAEYGSIYGKVISVTPFPTSSEAIQAHLQNSELVKKFTNNEVPIEVRVRLQKDPRTISGLKWSSSQGPNQTITAGNLATALITIREQPPVTLILPTLKKMMGVE